VHKYDEFIDHILKAIINHSEGIHTALHFTDTTSELQATRVLSSIERVSCAPVDTCSKRSSGWNEANCYLLCWIRNTTGLLAANQSDM